MFDLDELRAELDDFAPPEKKEGLTAREERIIAGFEDIQRFVAQHGRVPQQGEDKDIFERLYAVRLARLCQLEECRSLLLPLDHQALLTDVALNSAESEISDEELLAELVGVTEQANIRELRFVRSQAEIRTAEEIANREPCVDFTQFQPLFEQVERELKAGIRQTVPFSGKNATIEQGCFYILSGQLVYVAEVGEFFKNPVGDNDARLRVIYHNGTESNLLLLSLRRALYKDEAGRRLTETDLGPLFGETQEDDDIASGTIYVLRSLSDHPFIAEHRELIHKIGVTGGTVETRIANAKHDATYLLADVEVVATYKLANINRTKLEGVFHRLFAPAQLELTIKDRFGHPVKPREWFLVPLHVIDEAVERVRDGSISEVTYEPQQARLLSGP